jgi:hypothetical protein
MGHTDLPADLVLADRACEGAVVLNLVTDGDQDEPGAGREFFVPNSERALDGELAHFRHPELEGGASKSSEAILIKR